METSTNNKSRRSFSTLAPSTSGTAHSAEHSPAKPSLHFSQVIRRRQILPDLKPNEPRDSSTVASDQQASGESPRTGGAVNPNEKRRRSFSLNESVQSVGSNTSDSNMNQYFNETSTYRSMRSQLNLPPEVRLRLDGRKHLTFRNLALGVLREVESRRNVTERRVDRYEPTYQLGPGRRFNEIEIEKIARGVLKSYVSKLGPGSVENVMTSLRVLVGPITSEIKTRVVEILDKRYRLVVYMGIIDRRYQGVIVATKCLWDVENDFGLTVREDFKNFSVIVNLFAVYHE